MNVMRTTVATVVAATLSLSASTAFAAASLTGAGATFPAPVYAKWADTYQKETGNKVNYQGIGSSGGVFAVQNQLARLEARQVNRQHYATDYGRELEQAFLL